MAVLRQVNAAQGGGANNVTVVLGLAPLPGNLLTFAAASRDNSPNLIAGVTHPNTDFDARQNGRGRFGYRFVQPGDPAAWAVTTAGIDSPTLIVAEWQDVLGGAIAGNAGTAQFGAQGPSPTPTLPGLVPAGLAPWIEIAQFIGGLDGAGNMVAGPGPGWTLARGINNGAGDAFGPYNILIYRRVFVPTDPVAATGNQKWGGAGIAYRTPGDPPVFPRHW